MRYPSVSLLPAIISTALPRCFQLLAWLLFAAATPALAQGPGDKPLPEPTSLSHPKGVFSVVFTTDNKSLVTGCIDKHVRVWDVASGKELRQMEGHTGQIVGVAVSPDGKNVASASDDGTVRLWDLATGKETRKLEHNSNLVGVAFSPDGKTLASAGYDQTVRIWDANTGKEIRSLNAQANQLLAVAFSPDGRTLAFGGVDMTVRFWSTSDGKETRRLQAHTGYVRGVAFSPDGRLFASAAYDSTTRIWEAASGRSIRILRIASNDTTGTFAPAFSPDGRTIAVACEDDTVRVWELATGQLVRSLTGHRKRVYSVAFSPDGKFLASGSDDGKALIWDLGKIGAALGAQAREAGLIDIAEKWKVLAKDDAGAADEAAWALVIVPDDAIPFLRDHLRELKPQDKKRIDQWIADLDGDEFAVREAASEALAAQGNNATEALRRALEGKPSVEAQRRLEDLLAREVGPSADQVQALRSLAVLERIGSPAARDLLQKLAEGKSGEFLKRDAQAALDRLGRRPR
jgi:Tol biopolymer transport system component